MGVREVGVREVGVREVGVREVWERRLEVFMGEEGSSPLATNLPWLTGVSRESRLVRAMVARTWGREVMVPGFAGAIIYWCRHLLVPSLTGAIPV